MKHSNYVKAFFQTKGKVASQKLATKQELIELGFTGQQLDRFYKQANAFARQAWHEFLKCAQEELPMDHGTTPAEANMATSGKVPTDHDQKDELGEKSRAAIEMVQDLLDINDLQDSSGEGVGETLSSVNVTSASNSAQTQPATEAMKTSQECETRAHKILRSLLR